MISRVAENCFWLMRYVERCDAAARLLRVHSGMLLDTALPHERSWRPLLIVLGEGPRFRERFGEDAAGDGEAVQEYLTWDDSDPVSIRSCLAMARENARTIRETVSLEMWDALNSLWIWFTDQEAREVFSRERPAFYEEVSHWCYRFHGACHNTMLHEEAFDFMRLGLNLERAGQTARILDLAHHALGPRSHAPEGAIDAVEWIAILRSCSAYEPFFKKRSTPLSGPTIAQFLIFERAFPGSILHGLTRAKNFLGRIRDQGDQSPVDSEIGSRSVELLDRLLSDVEALDTDQVLEQGIHHVLTWIVDRTAEVSVAVDEDYFLPMQPASGEPAVSSTSPGA